jgi:hypothetical protein
VDERDLNPHALRHQFLDNPFVSGSRLEQENAKGILSGVSTDSIITHKKYNLNAKIFW